MTDTRDRHTGFMSRALEIAQGGWGQTHPNPMVGAVIVENGKIVAEGWHRAAGQAHAEIEALRALGRKPTPQASLYITLEPCSTTGRTGACTEAIIQSGIRNVIVGAIDPNPDHRGSGLRYLREAGIEVTDGVLAEACEDLNLIFNHWITRQSPLLAVKIATTLDGKFSAANGHSKWITGENARKDVMRWRRLFPAIAVSAATALADDPALTSRLEGSEWCPRRFVFDRRLETIPRMNSLQLFNDAHAQRTTLVCGDTVDASAAHDSGVTVWQLLEEAGHIHLEAFRQRCAAEAIHAVYLETGPRWTSALLADPSVDYLFHYIAPKYMADSEAPGIGQARKTNSIAQAIHLHKQRQENFGEDQLVRGWLRTAE